MTSLPMTFFTVECFQIRFSVSLKSLYLVWIPAYAGMTDKGNEVKYGRH